MRLIDLTHTILEGIPTYQGGSPPHFEWNATFEASGRTSTRLNMSTHTGTHIDAPLHFIHGGATVDSLPLESLVGQMALINASALPRDGRSIDPRAFRRASGHLQDGDIAVVFFGVDRLFGLPAYTTDFPVLALESIEWLLDRKIRAFGTDAVSVDPMDSLEQANHKLLLGQGVPIMECLANLAAVGQERCLLAALPLKLGGREASPCRVIAMLDISQDIPSSDN